MPLPGQALVCNVASVLGQASLCAVLAPQIIIKKPQNVVRSLVFPISRLVILGK